MNGGHGRVVLQHAVLVPKEGQEHVPMMPQTLASHLLSQEVAPITQTVSLFSDYSKIFS